MSVRISVLPLLLFLFAALSFANAKDKNKVLLPDDVLSARTVLVVVNPEAETSLEHPNDNRNARQDVEQAIMRWGRFTLALEPGTADLIIVVQKGSGKLVSPTIEGGPLDERPVIVESTGDSNGRSTRVGVQRGHPTGDPGYGAPQNTGPHLGERIGTSGDTFMVYRGDGNQYPDGAPVWRSTAKDGLRSPGVPAVDQFRKVIEEAERQAKKRTKQSP